MSVKLKYYRSQYRTPVQTFADCDPVRSACSWCHCGTEDPEAARKASFPSVLNWFLELQHVNTVTNTVTVYKWVFLCGNGRLDKTLEDGARSYFYFVCPHSGLTAELSQHSREKRVTAFPNSQSYGSTTGEILLWQHFVDRTTRLGELKILAYEHTVGRRMAALRAVGLHGTGLTVMWPF